MPRLAEELRTVLAGLAPGGPLWSLPEFAALPVGKKRVADIAFSGDGEPTACTGFARAVERAAEAKHAFTHTRDAAKLVVITNATRLDKPDVRDALRLMDGHGGEVWAKLDAGTPEHFARINGTAFPFAKVLGHILDCARERPIVIQSCFARIENAPPPAAEVAAYLERLKEFVTGGAQIKLVQVYTVARPPARGGVSSLSAAEMDALAARVQSETGLAAAAYYGDVAEISDRTA
jgi:wyosine [tRNA(Phe)-imidazoG37] synthetase (radical SAM superfamily)